MRGRSKHRAAPSPGSRNSSSGDASQSARRLAALSHGERETYLSLHQHRTGADRPLVLHQDAEPLGDFGVGFQQPPEIATENILV